MMSPTPKLPRIALVVVGLLEGMVGGGVGSESFGERWFANGEAPVPLVR